METLSERKQLIEQWHTSEEYAQLCEHFAGECLRLSQVAQKLTLHISEFKAFCEENTARRELAVGARFVHRGVYCPSPVFDLLVGNAHRGKILKRPTVRSKPTHEYGFDAYGRLLWCNNPERQTIEYLVYENDHIYGLILTRANQLCTLTEEVYENGKLVTYNIAQFHFDIRYCNHIHTECYQHDSLGLCAAQVHQFMPPFPYEAQFGDPDMWTVTKKAHYFCQARVQFERKDGFLSGYRTLPTIGDGPASDLHPISIQRKA